MAKSNTANLPVPYKPQRENPLVRGARELVASVARAVRPQSAVTLDDPVWRELLRGSGMESEAGVFISPDLAMTVSTVYGCVRLISETIGMLPLRLYERDGDSETIAEGHPVDTILFRRPNRWQTPFEWKQLTAAHVALRGNAYSFVSRALGNVQEVIPLNPARMNIWQQDDLTAKYQYTTYAGNYEEFHQTELMHLRGLTTDGLRGISPVSAARNALGLVIQQEKHASHLFTKGAQPIGVLKHPAKLGAEAIKNIRESFEARFHGIDNAHRTIVLEEGMEWTKVGLNAEETQFLQSRKFSRTDLAMFFGIPPHMIGDVEKSTSWGSGIEQQGIGFLTYTLAPWLTKICETINRDLLREDEQGRFFAQFDTTPLTRGDLGSRVTSLINLVNAGIMSRNEARKDLNMNPRSDPGGDDFTVTTQIINQDAPQVQEGVNHTGTLPAPAGSQSKPAAKKG